MEKGDYVKFENGDVGEIYRVTEKGLIVTVVDFEGFISMRIVSLDTPLTKISKEDWLEAYTPAVDKITSEISSETTLGSGIK